MNKFQLEGILKLVDVQVNPQIFRKISQSVANMPQQLQQVSVNIKQAGSNAAGLNQRLNQTANALSQNERVARLFLNRMAQFAILLPTFSTLNKTIQGGVKFLFEFDNALRDIVKTNVKELAGQMDAIGEAALKTAVDLGVTTQEVLEVTKTFVQAGLEIADAQKRAQLAIIATQVSTLKSADAVEFLLSVNKQFGLSGDKLAQSLDALVKVEDLSAVEAQDVAEAFRAGGNSLAEFGKDINQGIGLISALREQTRKSGSEIGTFFKTLQTRIFAAGESRSAVEALGVSVENLDGSLRPTLAVLTDLKKAFGGLTESQAASAAKAIAGTRQFESLIATLNSVERANELAASASQAAGAVDSKRTITDQKLDRQLGKLIAQGQELAKSLGDAGVQDALKSALQIATKLLDIFTSITKVIGELGGNLAPLLALGGIQLGKSIFGLAGGGLGGGGKSNAPAPGQADFIGPLTKTQAAIATVGVDLTRFGSIVTNSASLVGKFSAQVATNTTLDQAHGLRLNIDTQSLQGHAVAIKENAVALARSTLSLTSLKKTFTETVTGLGALVVIGSFLPKLFDTLAQKLEATNTAFGRGGSDILKVSSEGVSLAATFAALGKQAAITAGTIGIVTEAFKTITAAIDDNNKARDEETARITKQGNTAGVEFRIQGGGNKGAEAAGQLFDALASGLKGKKLGEELNKSINDTLAEVATSLPFKDLNVDAEDLRNALLGDIDVLKNFINLEKEKIGAVAEANGRTAQFNDLMAGLQEGTLNVGQAFSLLTRTLGAGEVEISDVTGRIKQAFDFKEFTDTQKIIDFADEIRNLGQELEVAKAGPAALKDDLKRLDNEFMLTQRSSQQTQKSLREQLNAAIKNLGNFNFSKGVDFQTLLKNLLEVPQSLDQKSIDQFTHVIRELPKAERDAADEILKIVEQQTKDKLELQKKENDLIAEQQKRAKDMFDEEAAASINAFESTRKFSSELRKFGDAVTTDVLSAFQNISLNDVTDVLKGGSQLSKGIQQIISGAFAEDKPQTKIVKAQTELNAIADESAGKLEVLDLKLKDVNRRLADQANSNSAAALTAEKHGIELEIEKTKQQATVDATEAKIKVLAAEKEAAEKAAELEKRRLELIEKVADASRNFAKELRDSERSFNDFRNQKIADLFKQEADARGELQDKQKEVIESTRGVADAYKSLIQAQLEFGNALAEARVKSNLLGRDIAALTGDVYTFDGQLSSLNNAFTSVLNDANITLQKRIDLERQLGEETLSFLQQARDSIVQAGTGIFGQTGQENQALGRGIAGLQLVADKLGGSFQAFLHLTEGELSDVSKTLLGLPVEFRKQILDALSFLPSTANIGGFTTDQLKQAIGQVGAGVAPEEGLPAIQDLNKQQVEQLQKLQDLSLQDAKLQFAQVVNAKAAVDKAEEQLQASKLLEERAQEGLEKVHDSILVESSILDQANQERRELAAGVVAAQDRNTLLQIEKEAQLFAEQNSTFRDVGENIIRGITSAISAKLSMMEAQTNLNNLVNGHIPNFAGGNLTPKEAAGLLRAGMREKRAMPTGAGLAVANTSEAVIPMRHRGFVPNFDQGNFGSSIAASINAVNQVPAALVAAISASITSALATINSGGGDNTEAFTEIVNQLSSLNNTLDEVKASNSLIQSNTATDNQNPQAKAAAVGNEVRIVLQTNQNNTVTITGLENLRSQLEAAVKNVTSDQVDKQLALQLDQLDSIFTSLRERGLLSSFSQPK